MPPADQVTDPLPGLQVDRLAHFGDLGVNRLIAAEAHDVTKHDGGVVVPTAGDEVPRRLRDGQRQQTVQQRRQRFDHEHPPPGVHPPPELLRGTPGDMRDRCVGHGSGEDTHHDGHLPQRAEPATQP